MKSTIGSSINGMAYNGVTYKAYNILMSNVDATFQGGLTSVPSVPPEMDNGYPEYSKWGNLPSYAYFLRHIDGITIRDCNSGVSPSDVRSAIVWRDVKLNVTGRLVSILAKANNQYVCADTDGRSPLIANRTSVGDWESFWIVEQSDGTVGLLAKANFEYACADSGGSSPLIANRTAVGGDWEKYTVIDIGGGYTIFRAAANDQYVCADTGGSDPLIANRAAYGDWESFIISDL